MDGRRATLTLRTPSSPPRPTDWRVLNADCLTAMRDFAPGSFGLIITSPKYNIGIDYGVGKQADKLPGDEFREFNRAWLTEAFRVAGDGCRAYVAVSEKMLWWFKPMAEEIGWTYSQMFVWCKTNFVGGTRRITGEWNSMIDWFLIFRKGAKTPMLRWDETNTVNWFRHATPQSNFGGDLHKEHPAQWPLPLIRRFVMRTPGNPILDPFCGSGVVGKAAVLCGRDFTGIDVSESYCAIARRRIEAATRQGKLEL